MHSHSQRFPAASFTSVIVQVGAVPLLHRSGGHLQLLEPVFMTTISELAASRQSACSLAPGSGELAHAANSTQSDKTLKHLPRIRML
jgi:hypothetical protein